MNLQGRSMLLILFKPIRYLYAPLELEDNINVNADSNSYSRNVYVMVYPPSTRRSAPVDFPY